MHRMVAHIGDLENCVSGQLALDSEVPGLYIRRPDLRVDGAERSARKETRTPAAET